MGYPETGARCQRGTQPDLGQLASPELTRNVGQNADAVPLTVDVTGAVAHARQSFNCAFYIAMSRFSTLPHRTNQRTRIALIAVQRVQIRSGDLWSVPFTLHGWRHLTLLVGDANQNKSADQSMAGAQLKICQNIMYHALGSMHRARRARVTFTFLAHDGADGKWRLAQAIDNRRRMVNARCRASRVSGRFMSIPAISSMRFMR